MNDARSPLRHSTGNVEEPVFLTPIFLTVRKIGSEKWLEIDNTIYQESSHIIPALINKPLQRFASSRIIPNLPENWHTVSDCSIRFVLKQKGRAAVEVKAGP